MMILSSLYKMITTKTNVFVEKLQNSANRLGIYSKSRRRSLRSSGVFVVDGGLCWTTTIRFRIVIAPWVLFVLSSYVRAVVGVYGVARAFASPSNSYQLLPCNNSSYSSSSSSYSSNSSSSNINFTSYYHGFVAHSWNSSTNVLFCIKVAELIESPRES